MFPWTAMDKVTLAVMTYTSFPASFFVHQKLRPALCFGEHADIRMKLFRHALRGG